ncbi:MAG: metal ABC transporter substrate-binding protein [Erysipelotrichaceae bacterium]
MKKIIRIIISMFLIISLLGCSRKEGAKTNEARLEVYTTYYAAELIVKQLAGDLISVNNIYPEGSDRHNYELSAKELADISNSDLVIYANAEEDKSISQIIDSDNDTIYFDSFQSIIPTINKLYSGKNTKEYDAHIWTTPFLNIQIAEKIKNILIELDSSNTQIYQSNYEILAAELHLADQEYQKFADVQSYPLILTHDAYAYYDLVYGIEYISVYGVHHDDEPSSAEIAQIIDNIKSYDIPYIYAESNNINNTLIQQIALETNIDIRIVDNLSTFNTATSEYQSLVELLLYNLAQFS